MPMNFSPAGQSLFGGLGQIPGLGDALGDQVAGETDELRKKRLLQQQQQQLLGPGGSAASASLFGSPLSGFNGTGLIR
jgi:hypothetical protein